MEIASKRRFCEMTPRKREEVREKSSDDVVSMASDLGYSMHPSMDPDINRSETKQKKNSDSRVYSVIAETIAYVKKLNEK